MNTLLWILQIVLALIFTAAGAIKLIQPRDQLANTLGGWVYNFPPRSSSLSASPNCSAP
jgi:hypothetical protein